MLRFSPDQRRVLPQSATRLALSSVWSLGVLVSWWALAAVRADEPSGATVAAATVNGEPILLSEVARELQGIRGARALSDDETRWLQARLLDRLIRQRLIVQSLRTSGQGASPAEIDLAISQLEKQLQLRELTLAAHLQQQGMSKEELRRLVEWRIVWQRFLARYLTDQNLETYFQRHRREFDGTRLRVAHILLQPDAADASAAITRLSQLREAIVSGQITFEEAARGHSVAPTAAQGGEIGFISRREPMPEAFSAAAFALAEGEVSPPVVSPFGVHLIRCLEVKPGQKEWTDVREELTAAVRSYLFVWASDRQLPAARIEFTNAIPYLRPGTEELVEPAD